MTEEENNAEKIKNEILRQTAQTHYSSPNSQIDFIY